MKVGTVGVASISMTWVVVGGERDLELELGFLTSGGGGIALRSNAALV